MARVAFFQKNAVLAIAAFVIADVLAAEVAHLVRPVPAPDWFRELERSYRVAHPVYHHGLKPRTSATGAWGGRLYPFHVSSLGFRDREPRDVPPTSARRRVLFLGDSVTEGTGVAWEHSFVGILAGRLASENVEVLNAAVGSYSPTIHHAKTRHLLETVGLRVDEVVVCLDVSDPDDELGYRLEDGVVLGPDPDPGARMPGAPSEGHRFLKRHSATVRLIDAIRDRGRGLDRWDRSADPGDRRFDAVAGSDRARWPLDEGAWERVGGPGIARAAEAMGRLDDLLDRHGIPWTVVVYPWPVQILAGEPSGRPAAFWSVWTDSHGVGFVDLGPGIAGPGRDPWEAVEGHFIPWDSHFHERGHAHVAELLGPFLSAPRGP